MTCVARCATSASGWAWSTTKFEARFRELVEDLPDLAVLVEPLLVVCGILREQLGILHRRLLAIVRDDDVCRRLVTVLGVGPVVALTYRATVDVPTRFRKSFTDFGEQLRTGPTH
jgi:transposase